MMEEFERKFGHLRRNSIPEDVGTISRRMSMVTGMTRPNVRRGSTRQAFLVSEAKTELREMHRLVSQYSGCGVDPFLFDPTQFLHSKALFVLALCG
jgi:hypothetical protein